MSPSATSKTFRTGISTFERFGSTSSASGLTGHFIVVATELGGGEARERISDIEPRWLVVHMEGEEVGLPVEGAGSLAIEGVQ